jgi:hypothetical protein
MKDQTAMPSFGEPHRKLYRHGAAVPEVQSITNAQEAHSQEMHGRLVKYSIAMGIRMACIVLIFVVDGWFKLVPMVGAVILPWIAVVIANGGADTTHQENASLLDQAPLYELTGDPDDDASPVVLEGELVDDDDDAPDKADGGTGPDELGPDELGPEGKQQ